jgi:hypothetical protein
MSRFDVTFYQTRLLHAYRHLLRECGYLPDYVARGEIRRQTQDRFRNTVDRSLNSAKESSTYVKSSKTIVAVEIYERRLKTAFATLKTLQNANLGGQISLSRVLFHAYGRSGRRRYELLAPLLHGIKTHQLLASGESGYTLHLPVTPIFDPPRLLNDRETLQFTISDRYATFKTLVESQLETYGALERKPIIGPAHAKRLKKVTLDISRLNIWKRPLPQKRAKNLLNRWFLNLEKLVLPPIPLEEWTHLQSLVLGDKPFQLIPRRKRIAGSKTLTAVDLEKFFDMMQFRGPNIPNGEPSHRHSIVAQHINPHDDWLEDQATLNAASNDILLSELDIDINIPIKRNNKDDPHTLTQRYLRRAYAQVFSYCCSIPKSNTSEVIWGKQVLNQRNPITSMDPLFDMVTNEPSTSFHPHRHS